ncbi:hypothetical protein BLL42_05525 [Pseudomonas frederiksbergensis]|uniref:Phosphoenolpyruvate synthase n=1 Tax=Pseudomonas frederiksbergensis TaxID=104087 RepID=A0A1J0EGN8_9PSED|nr:PEP/pyruvate-binding domain-containing protein [Pseudomonas frederiksbergensis]APC15206.1 hypothetical protein BLL42_05525 [Pseudomonas frederiksbergensis]
MILLEDMQDKNVGGKFYKQKVLKENGFNVPEFVCLAKEKYDLVFSGIKELVESEIDMIDFSRSSSIAAASRNITGLFLAHEMSSELKCSIECQLAAFSEVNHFAIRSSMVAEDSSVSEDSQCHAFAGMSETFLYVDRATITSYIKRCWASGFSSEALIYRKQHDINLTAFSISVGIQRMVPAQRSFVMFTVDPSNYQDRTIIAAGYGLGEGIVQEKVEVDHFFIDNEDGGGVTSEVKNKRSRMVFDSNKRSGIVLQPLASEWDGQSPVLSEYEIKVLKRLGQRIENLFGCPQDIEGAFDDNGEIYILQSRPVNMEQQAVFWSNYNLTENYPGLSTPLTFSFSQKFYTALLTDAYVKLGATRSSLESKKHFIDNVLGYLGGGIYYNINNFMESHRDIFSALPFMKQQWERRIALPTSIYLKGARNGNFFSNSKIRLNLICNMFQFRRRNADFFRWWHTTRRSVDLNESPLTTIENFNVFYSQLRQHWGWTVTSGLSLVCLQHIATRLIDQYKLPVSTLNTLLGDSEDITSANVIKSSMALADEIRSDKELIEVFEAEDYEVWRRLNEETKYFGFLQKIQLHLDCFGARGLQELKLENPSYRFAPEKFIKNIKLLLASQQRSESDERDRQKAAIIQIYTGLPVMKRLLLQYVVDRLKGLITVREDTRYLRSEVFDYAKHVFYKLARDMQQDGALQDWSDVFYLAQDEVFGYFSNTALTQNNLALIDVRRQEFNAWDAQALESSFFTKDGEFISNKKSNSPLSGLGSSSGIARGRVKVVTDPQTVDSIPPDTILVARETDPGWLFLMINAKGMIVEKGSLLSHTAITGRKFGIPTVIGVDNCTQRLKDGQEVEINGSTGEIRVIMD